MNPLPQSKTTTLPLLVTFVLSSFALAPRAQAVNPAPDGGYPHGNTAEGADALFSLNTGPFFNAPIAEWNTAIGFQALYHDISGTANTAVGGKALFNNTGTYNTAVGGFALFSNTSGSLNTATGLDALYSNTAGAQNTATGLQALFRNTAGSNNTATGTGALFENNVGVNNTATGLNALRHNKSGFNNTADGIAALGGNNNGTYNTAIGASALSHNTNGNFNIAIGANAGGILMTGDNNIYIGAAAAGTGESGKTRIGTAGGQDAAFIAGISGSAIGGTAVVVNGNGRLGVASCSQRSKNEIKPMANASEAILALRPVTFRYKEEIDPDRLQQFGLVAEDVEKINPELVARDAEGKAFTVRYEAVNAMLLNEFLKEHRKVQKLEKEVKALTVGLQKVSAQLETSKPAPRLVGNNR